MIETTKIYTPKLSVAEVIMRYTYMYLPTPQKGRYIGGVTSVIDLENLSYQRHYYWPGINLFREVSEWVGVHGWVGVSWCKVACLPLSEDSLDV